MELSRFLETATPFIAAWVQLKIITGLRQGQLRQLHASAWDSKRLTVKGSKKGRDVIFEDHDGSNELELAIDSVMNVRSSRKVGSVYMFPNRKGSMYTDNGFRNLWQYAMSSYLAAYPDAERFTEHDLRAKLVSDSEDSLIAQKRVGHRQLSTTQGIYERKPKVVSVLKRDKK